MANGWFSINSKMPCRINQEQNERPRKYAIMPVAKWSTLYLSKKVVPIVVVFFPMSEKMPRSCILPFPEGVIWGYCDGEEVFLSDGDRTDCKPTIWCILYTMDLDRGNFRRTENGFLFKSEWMSNFGVTAIYLPPAHCETTTKVVLRDRDMIMNFYPTDFFEKQVHERTLSSMLAESRVLCDYPKIDPFAQTFGGYHRLCIADGKK